MGTDDDVGEKITTLVDKDLVQQPAPSSPDERLSIGSIVLLCACVGLWLALGIVAVCIYFAAKPACAHVDMESTCTMLVVTGSMAASCTVLACCAVCLVMIWQVVRHPKVRYVRVDQAADAS